MFIDKAGIINTTPPGSHNRRMYWFL